MDVRSGSIAAPARPAGVFRRSRRLRLRACESFDFGDSRHESNQGLTTPENAKSRINSHTVRRRLRSAKRRMMADPIEDMLETFIAQYVSQRRSGEQAVLLWRH